VALGVDLPIGVPRAYAVQRGEQGFMHFLRQTAGWPDFSYVPHQPPRHVFFCRRPHEFGRRVERLIV
jgi:hypothetical protein